MSITSRHRNRQQLEPRWVQARSTSTFRQL